MRKYEANTEVKGGYYFDRNEWNIVTITGERGVLPGEPTKTYVRVPVLALFVLAPLMGALFVMFLPFIGFAMLFEQLGKGAFVLGNRVATTVTRILPDRTHRAS